METRKKVKRYFFLSLIKKADRTGIRSQASYLAIAARVRAKAERIRKMIFLFSACLNLKKKANEVKMKKYRGISEHEVTLMLICL